MTAIKTDIDAQPNACILPFAPVGTNTATNVQDAIQLAGQLGGGGGGGGGWTVSITGSAAAMVSGTLYVVSGAAGDVPLALPAAPSVGNQCAVYLEDYSSTQTATIDSGTGFMIGGAGMGAQTHRLGGQGAFCLYRYIGGSVWMTEQPLVTKQVRYKASSFTLNKIYDNAVVYVSSGSSRTVTVPSDTSEFLPIGYQTEVVRFASGAVTIVADTGVTINTAVSLALPAQFSRGTLTKIDANQWLWSVEGALSIAITESIDFQIVGDVTADGGPGVIAPGFKGFMEVPFSGVITGATIISDITGSAVIDIWNTPFLAAPPTALDTIISGAKLTMTAAKTVRDTTLTGWSKNLGVGDILGFNVDSASGVKRLLVSLSVLKN